MPPTLSDISCFRITCDVGNIHMSVVKERLFGAITVMSEEYAEKIWEIIKLQFAFPEEIPSEEEQAIICSYKNNEADYQPFISHDDLKRELGH